MYSVLWIRFDLIGIILADPDRHPERPDPDLYQYSIHFNQM
jgi:hypothetical protein